MLDDFYHSKDGKFGFGSKCKVCQYKSGRIYRSKLNYLPTDIESKVCSHCNIEKPITEFHKRKKYKDGYENRCKVCVKSISEKYCKDNAIIVDYKICNRCGIEKSISEFRKLKYSKDGHKPTCKECTLKIDREYQKTHIKEHKEACLNYYKNNSETIKISRKKFEIKNPTYYKDWRDSNKKYLIKYHKYWESNNQGRLTKYRLKSRDKRNTLRRKAYKNNPNKFKAAKAKRRNFGFEPINNYFECSHAHHLWLNDNIDLVIYMPNFLHKLHSHDHNKPETMSSVNALALDYLINEEFYKELYYKDDEINDISTYLYTQANEVCTFETCE